MKKLLGWIILAGLFFTSQAMARTAAPLKFGTDGKFKIAQFTDLHWDPRSPNCAVTTATIQHVLQIEKPDLAILTGDVVTSPPAKKGWEAIIRIFEEAQVPFAVTMGNHDAEQGYTRETIYDWLERSPYFVGEKGPADLAGCGNYVIEVQGSTPGTAALLYCLDSHDYPENTRLYGHYDWLRYDQIAWYRQQSRHYAAANGDRPLPALAFFHIPLPEYQPVAEGNTTIGHQNEEISSPRINSGLFASMIEQGDVMGVFAGHDHNNDYIGIDYGIALGFGRTTGADARGKLERGGRIIELTEGRRRFDTWICTAKGKEAGYYYPSGLSAADEKELTYLSAENIRPVRQGVRYTYYEGPFRSTADLTADTEKKSGILPNFTIRESAGKDHFGYVFQSWIKIPERGVYRFYTYSDDGSVLSVDGHRIVDNDGSRAACYASGKVALEAGFHRLEVRYFDDYMGEELEVGLTSRGIDGTVIPDEMLFLTE